MDKNMEHERKRFREMNIKQLYSRLNKITKPDKLQRFILMARECGFSELRKTAEERLQQATRTKPLIQTKPVLPVKVKVAKETKPWIQEPLRRAIEF